MCIRDSIGIQHRDLGEGVVAIVIESGSIKVKEEDIIKLCKQQLAGYKIPKKIILAKALPRNSMAKVQKNILRENYKDLFI